MRDLVYGFFAGDMEAMSVLWLVVFPLVLIWALIKK